jgi:phage-related protein
MAKATRRNTRKVSGILSYLYKPIGQIISAANNVTRASTNTVRKVVHNTANGVNRVGRSVTGRANTIVNGLVPNSIKRRFTRKSGRRTKGQKQ